MSNFNKERKVAIIVAIAFFAITILTILFIERSNMKVTDTTAKQTTLIYIGHRTRYGIIEIEGSKYIIVHKHDSVAITPLIKNED